MVADRSVAFMSAQAVIFQIEWLCFEEIYNVEYDTISQWPSTAGAAMMISSGCRKTQPPAKAHPHHASGAMTIYTMARAQGGRQELGKTHKKAQPRMFWTLNSLEPQPGVTHRAIQLYKKRERALTYADSSAYMDPSEPRISSYLLFDNRIRLSVPCFLGLVSKKILETCTAWCIHSPPCL